jgi:hypothetical protein
MNNKATGYTEVHGAMYCTTHGDFALEGNSEPDRCDSNSVHYPADIDCELRDLFIQRAMWATA